MSQTNDFDRSTSVPRLGALNVRRCDESEIPFIMATERTAGFEQLVGRWEERQHRSAFGDGRHAYFLGWDGREPIGFAIMRDWGKSCVTPSRLPAPRAERDPPRSSAGG